MIASIIHHIKNHVTNITDDVRNWFDTPDDLLNYRPSDGGWTINEILEHISLTSHFLLKLIDKGGEKALKRAEQEDWKESLVDYAPNLENMDAIANNLSFKWERPDHMVPTGQANMSTINSTILSQRDRCLAWLDRLADGQGVLATTTMTVNNLGKIDVYQYIYFLSLHMQRHIAQMERNKSEFTDTKNE
jgi:hypothetical protein